MLAVAAVVFEEEGCCIGFFQLDYCIDFFMADYCTDFFPVDYCTDFSLGTWAVRSFHDTLVVRIPVDFSCIYINCSDSYFQEDRYLYRTERLVGCCFDCCFEDNYTSSGINS